MPSDGRRITMCFYVDAWGSGERSIEEPLPSIGITMGDPGGIGPEVALKAACDPRVRAVSRPVIVADAGLIRRLGEALGFGIEIYPAASSRRPGQVLVARARRGTKSAGSFLALAVAGRGRATPVGKPSRPGGLVAGRAIEEAVRLAMSGVLSGIATAPVSKQSLALAGYGMIGHTELLARLTKTKHYAMMMKSGPLRVVLATTHVPLAKVASMLTPGDLVEKIKLTYEYLARYARLKRPKIAVCGLNPHAGEGGMLGKEERTIIAPAVRRAKRLGIRVDGPLSADTVFRPDRLGRFDAVVAMYHDQGIIPIKMGDPGGVTNVTLGIPIVRTSPGHGTAFDIAGKGVASEESMVRAIIECTEMAMAAPSVGGPTSGKVSRAAGLKAERIATRPRLNALDKIARALRTNAELFKNTGFSKDDR